MISNCHDRLALLASLLLMSCGCASMSETGRSDCVADDIHDSAVVVEYGRPNQVLDSTGWILGIPSKVALWDRRADNHNVSPETVRSVAKYLEQNDLSSVLIRVNQYDPLGEWKRLATNRRVRLGWRLTGGTLEYLQYAILPGRIFGEDWYNPFTNTINLYSDIPSLALTEAAYAKDVHQRQNPGFYATTQMFPLAGMWHKTIATKEVLSYVENNGTDQEREETYRILYPSYGGNWGAGIGSFIPFGHAYARLVGAAVGHTVNGVRKASPGTASPSS
jgi:hypothetical protein